MARCYNCMHECADGTSFCSCCGYNMKKAVDSQYFLPCGTVLSSGRYLVGLPVSTGGFGIVYRAWDMTFDRLVAIKEYYPSGLAARMPGSSDVVIYSNENSRENFSQGKERFLIEAKKMARFVDVPNIVDVYDCFEANQTAYMVMEFMEGMTYGQYLEQMGGSVSCDQAMNVVLYVLDALKQIHGEHVIHRDINPNNIFICKDGTVKLFDFGAACIDDGESIPIVTPGYAPPEQYSADYPQGVYTDIYAVGATLYRALTGMKPEESSDRMHADHVKPPHKLNSEVPKQLSNTVMRAMALKQELRFQSADEFRDALLKKKKVLDVQGEIARRRRCRLIQVAGVVLILGAVGSMFWMKRSDAGLRPAQLTVWIVADRDDTVDEAVENFRKIENKLPDSMQIIELQVEAWPQEEYIAKLKEAAEQGMLPDVFESTYLDEAYHDRLEPLDITLGLLQNMQDYYYLDQYSQLFPDRKQLPLCVQLPLVYVRQGIGLEGQEGYAVNPEDEKLYRDILGEEFMEKADSEEKDATEAFVDGTVQKYYSDSSDYEFLNKTMQAQYHLEFPEAAGGSFRFDHLWSVNGVMQGRKRDVLNRKKAGQWLIYYLLSEVVQDELGYGQGEGIPLHKASCDRYFAVYGGELQKLQAQLPGVEN